MYLEAQSPARASVNEIATRFNLSDNHLAKVATALVRHGFVTSGKGRNGGLTLAQPAAGINVGEVVRALTKNDAPAECFNHRAGNCLILPACGLRMPLLRAQDAFFKVLDGYTLADITRYKSELRDILGVAQD